MQLRNSLLFVALATAPSLYAQPSASSLTICAKDEAVPSFAVGLTYDVASIRPHPADDYSLSIANPPAAARYDITGVSMKNLISEAYEVLEFGVTGPAWIDSQRFDLHARGDEATDAILARLTTCQAREVKQQMLRALLADRVKLLVHRATKEGQGYDLVIAKGGPKLHESPPIPTDDSSPAAYKAGGMSSRSTRLGIKMDAHRYTAEHIAGWLTVQTHTPVSDKTGLTGTYDFTIEYSLRDRPDREDDSSDAPYPVLPVALQEQLGLHLEPTKVPIDTLIVDHIEQPSEN